jgi:uncharacterized membrane protein
VLPTLVLLLAVVLLRGAGALAIRSLATWRDAARWALSLMLLFTASAHFAPLVRPDMVAMVPPSLPHPELLVTIAGLLEILAAIGIQVPATRRVAGICLIAFLVAVFPANVSAAARHVPLGGRPATPLVLRLPMQLLFIAVAAWTTLPRRRGAAPLAAPGPAGSTLPR